MSSAVIRQTLASPESALYGDDRTVCTFVDGPQMSGSGDYSENKLKYGCARAFQAANDGH
jgi:hypothetical protein